MIVENYIDQFWENGWCELKGILPLKDLNRIQNEVIGVIGAFSRGKENYIETAIRLNRENPDLLYGIYLALKDSMSLSKMSVHIEEKLRSLLGQTGLMVEIGRGILMVFPESDRISYDWHQELHYHPHLPKSVHVWIPLFEPGSRELGTMSVLSGSHALGALAAKVSPKKDQGRGTTSLVPDLIAQCKERFEEVWIESNPGDCVFLHPTLIHRSNLNSSDRPRFTLSIRVAIVDKVKSLDGIHVAPEFISQKMADEMNSQLVDSFFECGDEVLRLDDPTVVDR